MTFGARPLRQKLRNALQPFFVFRLRQRVFHGVHRVVVGEVELGGAVALLRFVQEVLLFGWAMEHDVALFRRQLRKRNVGTHAHFACHLLHQIPHQRAPGKHRTLVDGL